MHIIHSIILYTYENTLFFIMDFAINIYRGPNTETQKAKGALFQVLQMASFPIRLQRFQRNILRIELCKFGFNKIHEILIFSLLDSNANIRKETFWGPKVEARL